MQAADIAAFEVPDSAAVPVQTGNTACIARCARRGLPVNPVEIADSEVLLDLS